MRAFYGAFLLIVLFAFLTFAIADELFVDNHDGTVTDTSSKLIWQQQVDGKSRSWDEASAYCSKLNLAGHSDWRLPSLAELRGLWTKTGNNQQIEKTYFPITKSGPIDPMSVSSGLVAPFWSSTLIDMQGQQAAGILDFSNGKATAATIHGIIFDLYVRCVRQ